MEKAFHEVTTRTLYADYFGQRLSNYGGTVPVGRMKQLALDRIFFWGEGAQIQPPASAMCLHRIIKTYPIVAASLLSCLKNDLLGAKELSRCTEKVPYVTRLLQNKLFHDLRGANSDKFKKTVLKFQRIEDRLLEKCLVGDITMKDLFQFKNLRQLFKYL